MGYGGEAPVAHGGLPDMTITDKQRLERVKHLGSSDVAAVLGLSPWMTPYDLWLEKTGKVDLSDDTKVWMEEGNRLEDVVIDYAAGRLGKLTKRGTERRAKGLPVMVHIDAIRMNPREPVEAKTSGILGPVIGEWGDDGTDHVPPYYYAQCMAHLLTMPEADCCHLAALLGGIGYRLYRVDRIPWEIEELAERLDHFWTKHVKADVPPPDSLPTLDFVRHRHRDEQKVVNVSPSLIQRWRDAKDIEKNIKKQATAASEQRKLIEAELFAVMGDAGIGDAGQYGKACVRSHQRASVDTDKLRAEHPEIAAKVEKVTTVRSLRFNQE